MNAEFDEVVEACLPTRSISRRAMHVATFLDSKAAERLQMSTTAERCSLTRLGGACAFSSDMLKEGDRVYRRHAA